MPVFLVFQGETYNEERNGEYIWSPKLNTKGKINIGYTTMKEIKEGDFILHNVKGMTKAISIAKGSCFSAQKPKELVEAKTTTIWDCNGYRVNTKYFDFDVALDVRKCKDWLHTNYIKNSAFTTVGTGKQQYMCHLADEHAIYLMKSAISLQHSEATIDILNKALFAIISDKVSEYSEIEFENINNIVNRRTVHKIQDWKGIKEPQSVTKSSVIGHDIPKRDPQRAVDALERSEYKCEFDQSHKTFLRKNGKPYTEPHHLIPISKYKDFKYSLDIMENIISLCSNCHNLLHYGRYEDKISLLTKLYEERINALKICGLDITLEELENYYK